MMTKGDPSVLGPELVCQVQVAGPAGIKEGQAAHNGELWRARREAMWLAGGAPEPDQE